MVDLVGSQKHFVCKMGVCYVIVVMFVSLLVMMMKQLTECRWNIKWVNVRTTICK